MGYADGRGTPIRVSRGLVWATNAVLAMFILLMLYWIPNLYLRLGLLAVIGGVLGMAWVRRRALRMMERELSAR